MSFTILGTGSRLGSRVVTNEELCGFFDTSDEWIQTRTGIVQRHIMDVETETVTDLAVSAAQRAMEMAGTTGEDIDYIICPTVGGDYITPSLACMVQQRIGASCPAVDVNAACSGFLYGMDLVDGLFARGKAKRVLMVAAEGLSRLVDWSDRSTAILFGDGAGAMVFGPGEDLLHLHLTSEGRAEVLYADYPKGNFPGRPNEGDTYFKMDGAEVYRFAVKAVATGIQKALQETGIAADEVDWVLLHQANIRIIDAALKKVGIPKEKSPCNIQDVGNISAASIPVLLDRCNRKGLFKKGDIMVLSGFGGGLTTGTAVLRWSRT